MRRIKRRQLFVDQLEPRLVLTSAVFPAYVDGVFSFGDPTSDHPYGIENTFLLESNPGADKTIYLDFDGHHSVNNDWGHNIVFPAFDRSGDPSTFTANEHEEIQKQWQNAAEDFAPFDVNVTTKDPGVEALRRVGGGDNQYGVRSIQTQATNGFGNGIGGVALLNSFNDNRDNPVFVFNKGESTGGMTISHEVGHALGLVHDGLGSQQYHPGTGSGQTSWGPLMGAPFGSNVTQWSNGDYANSTSNQNDLGIITNSSNGINYNVDDHGNGMGTATVLTDTGSDFEWGIIERNTDVDYWEFTTTGGDAYFEVRPFLGDPNLDIEATVLDDAGNVVTTVNPLNGVGAAVDINVAAGTYYLQIDGVGRDGRYSDYGSLGFYTVTADLPSSVDGDFNDDGLWNSVDIDALVADIIGPGTPATYDLTGDGNVDLADRDAWLAEAGSINLASGNPYLLGDANLDGVVDGIDFTRWNDNKFSSSGAWSLADFNADGFTDGTDFTLWNDNKFTSSDSLDAGGGLVDGEIEDADPYGEAPFWPLSHDMHQHDQSALGHAGDEPCGCPACCAVNGFVDEGFVAVAKIDVATANSKIDRSSRLTGVDQIKSEVESNLTSRRYQASESDSVAVRRTVKVERLAATFDAFKVTR